MYAAATMVEHAAVGFAMAVLSLFVLSFAVIAVVLVTISNSCWWGSDAENDAADVLCDESYFETSLKDSDEPIDIVLGMTPENASIV